MKFSNILAGLLVIAVGVLLLLFNSGVLPYEYKHVVFSWPMLLVTIGFVFLFSRHKWFSGVIMMLIGGFFLLPKLNIEGLDFIIRNGWAIGLMVGGVLIICKSIWGRHFLHCNPEKHREEMNRRREWHRDMHVDMHSRKREQRTGNESGYIDRNYVFGGANEKIDFKDFKGGEINCVFGGMELDLTDAKLAEGLHRLELNSVFGGIVLYVPVEWNIEIRQTQVFGRFSDNRPKPNFEVNENSTLILEANSVFGGGEIKCKN